MLWRYVNGRQEAYCLLQHHPTEGLEVKYIFNGAQLIGLVSQDVDELQQRSQEWRMGLVAQGWSEGKREPQAGVIKTRRVGVKV